MLAMASAQAMQISRIHLESGRADNISVECEIAFASRLAPTGSACKHRFVIDTDPCGSGLAREDVSRHNAALRTCHRCLLLRQLQIIHHPIHRQLAEHDQLRDTQQRPALRRGYEVGEVMGDGSG